MKLDVDSTIIKTLLYFRKFYSPTPEMWPILESTCNLIYSVRGSLRKGITRCNNLKVKLCTDVYKYLFGGKGQELKKAKRRTYSQEDFNVAYFPSDRFRVYNSNSECCYVDFPVIMYSYVKFSPITYIVTSDNKLIEQKRDFKELVCIKLIKKDLHHDNH